MLPRISDENKSRSNSYHAGQKGIVCTVSCILPGSGAVTYCPHRRDILVAQARIGSPTPILYLDLCQDSANVALQIPCKTSLHCPLLTFALLRQSKTSQQCLKSLPLSAKIVSDGGV